MLGVGLVCSPSLFIKGPDVLAISTHPNCIAPAFVLSAKRWIRLALSFLLGFGMTLRRRLTCWYTFYRPVDVGISPRRPNFICEIVI